MNNQWQLALHCKVFHYFDCLSTPEPVLDLLDEIRKTFDHINMDSDITANRLETFRPRRLKSTPKNWAKVRSEIQEGKVSTLFFGSLAPDNFMSVGVALHMFNEENRRLNPELKHYHDSIHMWVGRGLLERDIVTMEMCKHIMQKAWHSFHGVYGFADAFISHLTGLVSPQVEQEMALTMKAQVWTSLVELPGLNLREEVRDAYWLNYLNPIHLQKLNTNDKLEARVKAVLPQSRIETLPHSGLSLQISPSPFYDTTETWLADHAAATTLLQPILARETR